jgi:hypothetical protein
MIVVRELQKPSSACPIQEARASRRSWLHPYSLPLGCVDRSHLGSLFRSMGEWPGRLLTRGRCGDRMSGYLTTEEMQAALELVCHFVPVKNKLLDRPSGSFQKAGAGQTAHSSNCLGIRPGLGPGFRT